MRIIVLGHHDHGTALTVARKAALAHNTVVFAEPIQITNTLLDIEDISLVKQGHLSKYHK